MQYRLTFPPRTRSAAPHLLSELAGWVVIVALAGAPAALGCVHPWAITGLEFLLTIAIVLWLAGCLVEKRRPCLSRVCAVLCGLILLQGGVEVLAGSLWAAPGGVPVPVMGDLLVRLAVLLGTLLLTADLTGNHPVWVSRFWWAMALTGASISLFGIAQKAGLTDLAARHMEQNEGIYFATFNYHGTAGAFLNLAVPLCAGLVLQALRRRTGSLKDALLPGILFLVCLTGSLVNVSRAAQAILFLILALFIAVSLRWRDRSRPIVSNRQSAAVTGIVLLSIMTAACLFRSSDAARRWGTLAGMVSSERNTRVILAKVTVPMAEEAGVWGSGPGSYKILFPHSRHLRPELYANFILTEYVPGSRISMWCNAHNDYLQTMIEWGWCGSIAWGALLLGGLSRLLLPVARTLFSRDTVSGPVLPDRVLFAMASGLALVGMCLHALVDFPFQIASLQLYASVLLGVAWSSRYAPTG